MRDSLVFYVNATRYAIDDDASLLNLAQWLRERLGMVGTKVVCNEGDCGACSVLVGRPNGRSFDYRPIDACIAFPFQLDKTHIVTVEGLQRGEQLSVVQQAMVDCHGSQCGFCTPGFVTTMHGMLENQTPLGDDSLRYGLSGNLCRCTGYLQIIDAGKSIDSAAVTTIGELFPPQPMIADFQSLGDQDIQLQAGNFKVVVPHTVAQAVTALSQRPDATIVSGATDFGVLFNHRRVQPSDIICLSSIQDFDRLEIVDGVLHIGGGATWTNIENFIQQHVPQYHEILTRFGSPQIRNAGTLAGNLAGGSPIGDSIPFHIVMDSELQLTGSTGTRTVKLNDFYTGYRQNTMAADELITSIATPLPQDDERLVLYKISKRRDMDISTATLAMWVKLDGGTIKSARLAIGGVGPTIARIAAAEQFLTGKTLSEATMQQAGEIARAQITSWSDVRGGDEYRLQLAENLLAKSYHDLKKA